MKRKTIFKICALISGLSGIVILAGVFLPIFKYESSSKQTYPNLLSPEVIEEYGRVLGTEGTDSTRASNWFVGGAEKSAFYSSHISFYTLSIPKLRIKDATVAIGGEDLAQHLIQYPGTALPGKQGNSVIFGHSVLPIFYNPKNYITIFSTLSTLKKGDEIVINYDGISYKFRVEALFEVKPADIQVLEQDSSDSFLTLVTCVPPGDPRMPERLIVRARIVPL